MGYDRFCRDMDGDGQNPGDDVPFRNWVWIYPAILTALALLYGCSSSPQTPARQNIILLSLDTLRADALPAWGASQSRTPVLNHLARQGTLFSRARSPATWTLPAHTSLFSGLLPIDHGVNRSNLKISPDLPWLPQQLMDAGYSTAAFTGGGYVSEKFGMARGFKLFESERKDTLTKANAAYQWMTRNRHRPFFLFLHTFEIHDYFERYESHLKRLPEHPERLRNLHGQELLNQLLFHAQQLNPDELEYVRAIYRAALEETDRALEYLWLAIRNLPDADDTWLIIVSDHGEGFGEHIFFHHGSFIYEEMIHIPLLVIGPGIPRGRIVEKPVSIRQIPELLKKIAALSTRSPSRHRRQHREILQWEFLHGSDSKDPSATVSEETEYEIFSLVENDWKLILNPTTGGWHWFNLQDDPAEILERTRELPARHNQMQKTLLQRVFIGLRGDLVIRIQSQTRGGKVEGELHGRSFSELKPWGLENLDKVEQPELGMVHFSFNLQDFSDAISFRPGNGVIDLHLNIRESQTIHKQLDVYLGGQNVLWDGSEEIPMTALLLHPRKPPDWNFQQEGIYIFWCPAEESIQGKKMPVILTEEDKAELTSLGYVGSGIATLSADDGVAEGVNFHLRLTTQYGLDIVEPIIQPLLAADGGN